MGISIWSRRKLICSRRQHGRASYKSPIPQRHFTFELHNAKGALFAWRQTEGEYDWTPESEIHVGPQQADVMLTPDERTEDDWLQLGTRQELNGEVLLGSRNLHTALSRFPRSFVAKKASGRLAASVLSF